MFTRSVGLKSTLPLKLWNFTVALMSMSPFSLGTTMGKPSVSKKLPSTVTPSLPQTSLAV
ncbi:MAG: hypothetical protein DMF94_33110 [Acidobacteria bacterium]|nr:MAG: hypothetical protein DMF96_09770 [Acidobacteriota bacterium]PYR15063.1 MAG: hypothetical protein DMF94_33110 [Acidobacteriota bacterium]